MSITKIVRTKRRFGHSPSAAPYICYGVGNELDATCPSFAAAIDRAKEMGCNTVTVDLRTAPRDAKEIGRKAGVEVVGL